MENSLNGAHILIKLIVPVSICMIAVVVGANVTQFSSNSFLLVKIPLPQIRCHVSVDVCVTLISVGIFMACAILTTIVFVLLYKFYCYKILYAWMMITSFMLLFAFVCLYISDLLKTYNVPMDYISVMFALWNFSMVGLVSIYWKSPLLLQQAYLIISSSLIAMSFVAHLPPWTVWVLLAVMAVWDLIAVLCPKGPLKVLIETTQTRKEPFLPGLLFTSGILYMTIGCFKRSSANTKQYNEQKTNGRFSFCFTTKSSRPKPSSTAIELDERNVNQSQTEPLVVSAGSVDIAQPSHTPAADAVELIRGSSSKECTEGDLKWNQLAACPRQESGSYDLGEPVAKDAIKATSQRPLPGGAFSLQADVHQQAIDNSGNEHRAMHHLNTTRSIVTDAGIILVVEGTDNSPVTADSGLPSDSRSLYLPVTPVIDSSALVVNTSEELSRIDSMEEAVTTADGDQEAHGSHFSPIIWMLHYLRKRRTPAARADPGPEQQTLLSYETISSLPTSGVGSSQSPETSTVEARVTDHVVQETAPVLQSSGTDTLTAELPATNTRHSTTEHSQHEADDSDSGVKLGLGDFIFYSVLVGKASFETNLITALACSVSILIGLVFTMLLLVVYQRPLPALPISTAFGLVSYFLMYYISNPFLTQLQYRQIFV